ncbi:uncharacterized protein LOC141626932 [Silene latifolia]|uniref:uncharacterized protein LOC141626932 n=1 Tax=Silene latifolia TaxID=37657 RepID=UPI003D76D94A
MLEDSLLLTLFSLLSLRGKDSYMRAPNVSWINYCFPKDEGGLGMKASKTWNKALLGKYFSWIASKKDHRLVGWVNHVYMKGMGWTSYTPPNNYSWSWKKIAHTMIYRMGSSSDINCAIYWNTLNIPKTSFIYWAVMHRRLMTKDKIYRMGGSSHITCVLCGVAHESHPYLLYACELSKRSMDLLKQQLKVEVALKGSLYALIMWELSTPSGEQEILQGFITIFLVLIIWLTKFSRKQRFQARNHGALLRTDAAWISTILM